MSFFIPNEEAFIAFTPGPVGLMAPPGSPTAVAAVGSGTLVAGTYDYKVSAVNDTGSTLPSAEAAVTTISTGGVTVGWAPVVGATGYRIFGRSAGTEKLLTQVGNVTSWLDSGTLVPTTEAPPVIATASDIQHPKVADITEAVELTRYVTGVNFSATANTVPTPNLASLFEPSIEGTSTGTGTLDCYRDNEVDTAWDLLPRRTKGYMFVRRFGRVPGVGDGLEVWPVRVASRAAGAMTSGQVVNFTVTCAIPAEPAEAAVVVA